MNDVVVYAPCRVFQVRVSVGAGSTMSPLEQHVLEAVHAGAETAGALREVLGVAPRLIVDLLGDLSRAGHVSFEFLDEFLDERVVLSEQVRKLIADRALGTLSGTEISDEQRPMMLDTLSGLVSRVHGLPHVPDRRFEIPEHDGEAQLSGVDATELARAVSLALGNDQVAGAARREGGAKRVVRAYLSPASLTPPSTERRYRRVGIRVAIDADGRLVARLADDSLSGRHQEAAQARLTRLIEDRPNSAFVRALKSAAGGPPEEPETLASALAELADQAGALAETLAEDRKARHHEIVAGSRRIVRRLQGFAQQEVGITLLAGHAEHEAAILELIRDARTQLVLACPWVDYDGLARYVEALEAAARRGVQIVLLRGIGRENVPVDSAVDNALNALRRQAAAGEGAGTRVLVSPTSSSVIHAKLVVCDHRQAVVTSLNFLQPSRAGTQELGVRVTALPSRPSPAIEEMLAWSRGAMPDYTVGQAVITDVRSFGNLPETVGEPDTEPVPDDADEPLLTDAAADDATGGPAASAWAVAWSRRVEELTAAARRRRSSVRLIRDGEHRDMLWSALRTVRQQLLITSDGLAEDVVDQAFVDHVEQCLQRGADVTLIYRRTRRDVDRQAARQLEKLEKAAGRRAPGAGRLRVRQEDNHAKVLVADDEAVVTSFNFLSFEGYYGGVGRRRQRSEVGVRIYGGGFARRLLDTFGIPASVPTGTDAGTAGQAAAAAGLRAFSAAQRVLQRLTAAGAPVTGADLARLVGVGAEAFAVLDALRSCGAGRDQLEPVVAAALGQSDATDPRADGWWAWLSQRRFEAGDFTVAARLREVVPGVVVRPRAKLAKVATRRGTPDLAAAVSDAVLQEDLTPGERCGLLAVGVHELVQAGEPDVAVAVAVAVQAVGEPWAEFGATALQWWDEAGRSLPVDRVQRGERQPRLVADAAEAWAALDERLDAFERYSPPFTAGSGTKRFLLRSGGPLNLLALAARSRDREAVRSWLEDPRLGNVGGWVNAATRAAGITALIQGHLRPPFVNRVAAIVDAARAVAKHEDVTESPAEPFDEMIDSARACVASLQEVLPRVRAALADVDLPERALAEVALGDLDRLLAGERHGAAGEPVAITERWRHPELAVRMRRPEPVGTHEQARLLARGIADRHNLESAVLRLLEDGEYAVAEDVLDDAGLVDGRAAKQLSDRVDEERRAVVAPLAVRAQVLRDRAERVGSTDVDVALVAELARSGRVDAEKHLEELDRHIDQVERDNIADVERRVQAAVGADPSGRYLAWADQVRALLDAKEIPAARQVFEGGPGTVSLLPVEEPTAAWRWGNNSVDEILDWFDQSASVLAPPDLRDYVVDQAGESLLRAIRQLGRAPAADARALLAAAVEELIGVDGVRPQLEPLPTGGHRTTLLVPDEFRLPPMTFVGRAGGLPVTIGGEGPPDGSVWLATRLRVDRRGHGPVVVTLADLFSLLQSEKRRSGRPRSASSRRIGLIRTICRQLPVRDVILRDAFVGTSRADLRHQIWWLLHAFGVSPDGVAVDTLLYESGAHPRLLVHTLEHVVERARDQRSHRLEPKAFVDLRASVPYQEAVQAELLAELGDAQAAALFTMIFFGSADDLRPALDTIAADAGLEMSLDRLLDTAAVAADLRRAGYLVDDDSGQVALCECGITQLLRRGDPHEVAKQALRRLAQARQAVEPESLEARLQEAQFQRHLVEIRLHDERRRADRAEAALDRARGSAATLIRDDRYRREDRQQVEAWRSERVDIDLVEACRTVARDIEDYGAQVDIPVISDGPIIVVGSRVALRIILRNIIGNAEQAVKDCHARGKGTVSVTVSVAAGDPSHAVVDVEDNGNGFPLAVLERLARRESPMSTRHEGEGEGIVGAKVLLRLFGGDIEVVPTASPALRGAHVRMRIPMSRRG